MNCPKCGSDQHGVVDSRPQRGGTIRRRRVCSACDERFSTVEVIVARGRGPVQDDAITARLQTLRDDLRGLTDDIDEKLAAFEGKAGG